MAKTTAKLIDSDKLQSRIQDRLATVSDEEHQQWLTSPCTKALLDLLERDRIDLTMGWQLGNYDEKDGQKAQGQAFYILGLQEDIVSMKADQLLTEALDA